MNKNKLLAGIALLAIILFSIFLRYENFTVWQTIKPQFQYQNEYQMSNFDSYFYLKAAKDIQNGSYDEVDDLRRVPNGMKRPSIAPLQSTIASSISTATGVPVATVAIFMPIFFASLLAIIVFLLGIKYGMNYISALSSALFSIISITYVERTRIGVFDTDSLVVVFMLLIAYLFILFAEHITKKRFVFFALALFSIFLYYIWWNTASSVVIVSSLAPLTVAILFYYQTPKQLYKYIGLAITILIGLFFIREQFMSYFELLFQEKASVFPNNTDIGELNAVSLNDFIKKSIDNIFIFILFLIGLGLFIWKHRLKTLFLTIPILLAFAPFFAGNRFIVFTAPIMALAIGQIIQTLFNFSDKNEKIKPIVPYIFAVALVAIGIVSNYTTITKGHANPAAFENVRLLNALKKHTPENAKIWTTSDIGYQIQHYLDRGTYADGEFTDGELYYYLYFPFAADNFALSANFMQFYNAHGIQGMNDVHSLFPNVDASFKFLKKVLSLSPKQAEKYLNNQKTQSKLPQSDTLQSAKDWFAYLYPKQDDDIYLFLFHKMTQTASWFKQGNADLKTGETKGLPLFLTFNNLKERNGVISNSQIKINTIDGKAEFGKGQQEFQKILTYDGRKSTIKRFGKRINNKKFIFHWNSKSGFGGALSKEMSNTTLIKLFVQDKSSKYFEPVSLNSPNYQIWKVKGGRHE